MLPANLVSVYQQYKDDTNAVASWLASTAKSCGYPSDLLPGGSPQATGPERSKRLKGKARKEAKDAASQPQSSSPGASRPEYIIAIKDFIPLAEFVAASRKPVVSVPLAFAKILNRVISTRSGFGDQLAEHGNSNSASADAKHSYFVGVLEKVREILKPRVPASFKGVDSLQTPPDPIGKVGGKFAGLSVDEPSKEFLNAPDVERTAPVEKDSATYVAEVPDDLDEVLFAYFLLMNDLARIRDRIRWIWTNFGTGALELVTAAIATNTACDLARHLMEDITSMSKAHGGAMYLAAHAYAHQCIGNGLFHDVTVSDGKLNDATYDCAKNTYMVPFMTLKVFLSMLESPEIALLEGEDNTHDFGNYDPTLDWDGIPNRKKFEQDRILMMNFLLELCIVVRRIPDYPVCDEFIRGMQELDRNRETPMYLAFVAQVSLDIHHTLRGKVYSAQETCMSQLKLMDEDLALHIAFCAELPAKERRPADIETLRELRKYIKKIQDDPIHQNEVKMFNEAGIPYPPASLAPTHRLLKISPVICGLLLYHFHAHIHNIGLNLADSYGTILFPLHLHNALQQEKLLSPEQVPAERWEDMEWVLARLGKDSFYVGSEPPTNPGDYMKKLCLQMGTTSSAFSNSKSTRNLTRWNVCSKTGPRRIKRDRVPVTDMFIDRYVKNTGQVDWTPEHVDRIVSRSLYECDGLSEEGLVVLKPINDPQKLRERKKNIVAQAAGKKTPVVASDGLPPERLIRDLVYALEAESLTLVFPYLTLQRAAWSVTRAVRDACRPLLLDVYGKLYLKNEGYLISVVSPILVALADGYDGPFVKAGEVVKDQLRRGEGARARQRLQAMGYALPSRSGGVGKPPPQGASP